MTDQRTQFLIQVLDKIGGPLAAAVTAGPYLESESASAQRVAELLNRSVQLGLSIAGQMNLRDEGQADGVHLSLAAFAGPLMAGQYIVTGHVPGDSEIRQVGAALQAVLTFADNFTPAADSTLRLKNTDAGSQPADEALVHVQILGAFAPVFQVVSEYGFGKPEGKLMQEIAARLMERAADLREGLFGGDLPLKTRHMVDIVIIKTLCGLYAAAHGGETRRLMTLPDHARATITISMDPVWAAFDKQYAMVRIVAEQIVPQGKGDSVSSETIAPKAKALPAKSDRKLPPAIAALGKKTEADAPPAPPAGPPAANDSPARASANPMAFFAPGKKTGESE